MPSTRPPGARPALRSQDVHIPPLGLAGTLTVPGRPAALVVFAHGSGSSRFSPRNRQVAEGLQQRGIATLLFDLLLVGEEDDRSMVFDIALLSERLLHVLEWIDRQPRLRELPLGLFGASTGAAAALVAAARSPKVGAVVSRGGRPDLADAALARVTSPTLLIVGGADVGVIELNEGAAEQLAGVKRLAIVPGATHLFPEPGALEQVIDLAADWFTQHLVRTDHPRTDPGSQGAR